MGHRGARGGTRARRSRSRGTVARLLLAAAGLVLVPLVLVPLDAVPVAAVPSTLPGAGTTAPPTEPPTFANPVPAPAAPSPSPSRTPVAPPSGGTPTAPTIADPGDLTTDLARFSGRAAPGHGVRVADPAVPSASVCRTTARADGTWSCVGTVHSGPAQVFTVLDTTTSSLPSADAAPSDVIVPPVVTTRRPTAGAVTGTGRPGATVTVTRAGSTAVRTAVVGPAGTWHVSWAVGPGAPADGPSTVTATQTASTADGYRSDLRSAVSPPSSITIDRTAPAAPRIGTPSASAVVGARSVRIAGTAEPGTIVTAYVDDVAVCRAEVTASGTWSCRVADVLRGGAHRISAGGAGRRGQHLPGGARGPGPRERAVGRRAVAHRRVRIGPGRRPPLLRQRRRGPDAPARPRTAVRPRGRTRWRTGEPRRRPTLRGRARRWHRRPTRRKAGLVRPSR
ncbi:hypothetical protein [Curtobacterium sp. MCJR17_043]|uniref:hypothetical protein n=1 Tax=Curtobacterium sp. MCJR17_043 TaxID=2175660 RepID=UPI0024DFD66B|nr:hypothetical protein [Curtobacterium sp. MCJR17_043]WIB36669.1 hypothetical protein DEJ15_06195 [Curtobacterium sp. MCJR17_043]